MGVIIMQVRIFLSDNSNWGSLEKQAGGDTQWVALLYKNVFHVI